MNYTLLLGIIGLLTIGLGIFFYWYRSETHIQPTGAALLFKELREEAINERGKKLLAIQNEFNISDKAFDECWESYYQYVENDDLFEQGNYQIKSTDPIESLFERLLLEYGINPARVKLTMIKDDPNFEDANSVQNIDENDRIFHEIQINYQTFKDSDPGVNEVILRHEIVHLICYDSLLLLHLYSLIQHCGYSREQIFKAPSIIDYNHDMELRADRLSLYHNKQLAEYALEMYGWADKTLKNEKLNDMSISHPSYEQRAQEIKKLIKRMN